MASGSGWEEELRRRLHGIFMAEAAERLDALEAAVGALEAGAPDGDADRRLSDAFRHAHTLKGGLKSLRWRLAGEPADVGPTVPSLTALLARAG